MKWLWGCVVVWVLLGATLAQEKPPSANSQPANMASEKFLKAAAFLTRIRYADPDYRLILMVCLKENELNLLLSRFATTQDIQILVKELLVQLSKELPGEDLTVVAFRPVVPLREAAIARLNSRTGQISFLTDPSAATARPAPTAKQTLAPAPTEP